MTTKPIISSHLTPTIDSPMSDIDAPEINAQPKKVLVCDDDRTHLLLMSETLKGLGYDVCQANNGESALESYFSCKPDIILLDVNMPNMNGYEVCKAIRADESGADVPILMITGLDDHSSIENAFSAGATDFLPKPINWPMIKHRIKYMLRSIANQISLRNSEKELRFLAYYDALTHLPNRQFFKQQLNKQIGHCDRHDTKLAVMMIDLDSFKRINDSLGHKFGDEILQVISQRLTQYLRQSDSVLRDSTNIQCPELARLGGDEFTVMLSDVGSNMNIMKIARRINHELCQAIDINKYSVVVTASIGIAIYPHDGQDADTLLKHADSAMQHAKANSTGSFKFHSKDLTQRLLDRLQLEEYMREAIQTNMFELYYQPQIDILTGTVTNAEALVRLHHPTLGLISPADFIPVAEDTGLIIELGNWITRQACLQAMAWQKTMPVPITVSVNVSSKQISQPNFVPDLLNILDETGIDPFLIEVELTESVAMNNAQENIEKLRAIKALGIKLSIDDFGTGYSSLSYLKKFPIDTLKIDRSFVVDLSLKEEEEAIVSAIFAMAFALKLDVVVEGVETLDQLECIKRICGNSNVLVQGYYFAKPLPAIEYAEFVKAFKA